MANNTRSKNILYDENYETFKQAVLMAVTEILPRIIKEITPLILEKSKSIIEESATSFKNYSKDDNKNLIDDVDKFIYKHEDMWYSKLDKRKDTMFKYLRCDKQILLYNDCLEEERIYVPKKNPK